MGLARAAVGVLLGVWASDAWAVPTCTGFAVDRTVCAVGCTDTTIATSVTSAANDDVICVESGTYTAAITVSGKKVTVVEGDGQSVTINTGAGTQIVLLQNNGDLDLHGVTVAGNNSRRCFDVTGAGSALLLDGVTVQSCTWAVAGSAIRLAASTSLTVRDGSMLTGNGGGVGNGGTVHATSATVVIEDATFEQSLGDAGGALYLDNCTTAITDATFASNEADGGGGGAIQANNGTLTVDGGTFFDNHATASGADGGAIDLVGAVDLTLTGTVFDGCSALGDGGAIHHASSASGTIDLATFTGCVADADVNGFGNGGAVAVTGGSLSIGSSTFDANLAENGGGVYGSVGDVDVNASLFCGNDADDSGGGAYLTNATSSAVWDNNVFELNTCADDGGAVRVSGSTPVFRNNALVDNDSSTSTDGIWLEKNSSLTFSSNVVAWHPGTGAQKESGGGGSLSSTYNLYWQNGTDKTNTAAGTGDVTGTDPDFLVWTDNGLCDDVFAPFDATSPLVDAGDPNPAYDDPDGSRNDIGPFGGPNTSDADLDGFTAPADCNDANPDVFPGAPEVNADGVDQDCDGNEVCYVDGDQDGYGVATTLESADLSCTAAGVAPNNTDCADANANRNPGETETVANATDDNCDGSELCWQDLDNDNYGTTATVASADTDCLDGVEAAQNGDCNDGAATAFPGGTEVAGDGVDGNCNGTESCYGDGDGDGYGNTTITQSATLTCLAAGVAPNDDDCDDSSNARYPGAPEVVANSFDDSCGGGELCWQDLDNDNYGSATTVVSADIDCVDANEGQFPDDCNDGSPTIYPTATEIVADGIDQNCDTDELCYDDDDNDGVAGTSTRVSGDLDCTDPNEFSTTGDCNDANDQVSPLEPEIVGDGIDQDCDGVESCYRDQDADGYGGVQQDSLDLDCSDPGEIATGGDCNDLVAGINPGAVEVVADGTDSNCNGTETCYQDTDNDGYGGVNMVQSATLTCVAAGVSPNNTDCNNLAANTYPGAPEVVADGVDQSCDGGEKCWRDNDNDDYGTTTQIDSADLDCSDALEAGLSTDCNDGDAAIKPGATETVDDGVDQNCDAQELCWRDSDGDTYGSGSTQLSPVLTCVAAGVATNNTDCNDGSATVHPGAAETIDDGIDQDCSGTDTITCWRDDDQDTYGGPSTVIAADGACELGELEADDDDDCDDADPNIHPGATETKGDGIDQDCDGQDLIDCYLDADNDGFGANPPVIVPFQGDCGPAANKSDNASDCNDNSATTYPGAPDVCGDGIDADCNGVSDDDGDGLSYTEELGLGTNDCLADSDVDTIEDGDEVVYGSDPTDDDTDGDTLLDGEEWGPGQLPLDTDGDGTFDPMDSDDDQDLVPTGAEVGVAGGDNDGDGVDNHLDEDDDDDTLFTADEDLDGDGNPRDDDTDSDGVADWLDADDDEDGVATADEATVGADPHAIDSDGDTVLDGFEFGLGGTARDTDGDGRPDLVDDDDDDDAIPTSEEGLSDIDGDGTSNYRDEDSDGDGFSDEEEYARLDDDMDNDDIVDWWDANDGDGVKGDGDFDGATTQDENTAGTLPFDPDTNDDLVPDGAEIGGDPAAPLDTDGDLEPDWADADDDGDGVPTIDETGMACADPKATATIAAQGGILVLLCDGVVEQETLEFRDTDQDGTADYLDPDDDGDGVPTADEDPDADHDGDGVADPFDVFPEDGPQGDMDGDGLANQAEVDQGSSPYTDDTDRDGVLDPDEVGDSDQDGTADFADDDDDDDGVPTREEGQADTDGDGTPDHLDLDSDDDGLPDAAEGSVDADCDGVPDRVDDRADPACDDSGQGGARAYTRQGCGCDGSSGGIAGGSAVLLAGLVLRRRRR